ncbi:DUF1788 domain-containing protein [Methanomethylophilus alvi]|uniref:DUF1788 domain-containing protein n=1 Tax=Methanomethylophilus alvi TaxID=1291540 RepID=UPI0037DD4943
MILDIHDRLNMIEERIRNDPFFSNRSLSSGNGGYIFDYDPEDELVVRDFIKNFGSRTDLGFNIQVIDLYNDIMIPFLLEGDYLETTFDLEEETETEGFGYLQNAVTSLFDQGGRDDLFVNYIQEHAVEGNVIFIIGVGKCHPFIRSHMIINNFDSKMNGVKTVLFYPGTYDSEELRLFGTIASENYYRSMILVERSV